MVLLTFYLKLFSSKQEFDTFYYTELHKEPSLLYTNNYYYRLIPQVTNVLPSCPQIPKYKASANTLKSVLFSLIVHLPEGEILCSNLLSSLENVEYLATIVR